MQNKSIIIQNEEKMGEKQLLGLLLFNMVIYSLENRLSSDVTRFAGL